MPVNKTILIIISLTTILSYCVTIKVNILIYLQYTKMNYDISSTISQNSNFEQEQDNIGVGGTDLTGDADLPNSGYDDENGLYSTAISKLQIRLNDLINRHKVPLQLYDEIVHLINDYISSDNFSKYGKLKTRQSFIKQMESSHPSVTALRPVDKQVSLHDGLMRVQ